MCGICGIIGSVDGLAEKLTLMTAVQQHRGPDATGIYISPDGLAGLGHNRLSIIDLSEAGRQPMTRGNGRYQLIFNGEIYNYIELRRELGGAFHTQTDSEVLLAAYQKWGSNCLDRLIGMFAFAIWDNQEQTLFAARDRFGVKPFYYAVLPQQFIFASEIKTLHKADITRHLNHSTWSTYLTYGLYNHDECTFWQQIYALQPGQALVWQEGMVRTWYWYDLSEHVSNVDDTRSFNEVKEEYRALLEESVKLRFRADVPIGINLSGGLDSSTLLGLVHTLQGEDSDVNAFTFATGDEQYDELPWVAQMLQRTQHPHHICYLTPEEVPNLATKVQYYQDEPFGGLPTLAYSKVFEQARALGVVVLLDGQGLDEQWAGYNYYVQALKNNSVPANGPVQGSRSRSVQPGCLLADFRETAVPLSFPPPFADQLRCWQYRDARFTKIPRALRFNDRISMMHSTELREPFLDHRLFELALSQPASRKIQGQTHKWLLRQIASELLPNGVVEAPKRPLQTPQREWLRGSLKSWANDYIELALTHYGHIWLEPSAVRQTWHYYLQGESDNSFYIWQWINLGIMVEQLVDHKAVSAYD